MSAPHICYRCLTRTRPALVIAARPRRLLATVAAVSPAAVIAQSADLPPPPLSALQLLNRPLGAGEQQHKVRQVLREWESQHLDQQHDLPFPDVGEENNVANLKNRADVASFGELQTLSIDSGQLHPRSHARPGEEAISADNLVTTHISEPGDLVEIRLPHARIPILAIYLGFFGANYHFYISSGQWKFTSYYSSFFSITGFVAPSVLEPILAAIPKDGSTELYMDMERRRQGPRQEAASPILELMTRFSLLSQKVFQENVAVLDDPHGQVADKSEFRYMTLFEIARDLLPDRGEAVVSSPTALYAVHLALLRRDAAFRPVVSDPTTHRRDYLFEVAPRSHMATIRKIEAMTRVLVKAVEEGAAAGKGSPEESRILNQSQLYRFIVKARRCVSESRKHRIWTEHGILGPHGAGFEGKTLPLPAMPPPALGGQTWKPTEMEVLRFFEMWAGSRSFNSGSHLNAIASAILRTTQLYGEAELLSQAVGWTFLQEVGWIRPWELPTFYQSRLPETSIERGGRIVRAAPAGLDTSLRPDVAAGHRRIWPADSSVFCIDSPSTTLIDDGISLERIPDRADQFWIHVHVADPTSGIQPKSDLARYMALLPSNIFLQGYLHDMIPSWQSAADNGGEMEEKDVKRKKQRRNQENAVELAERYSLANGAPALTFSALVNLEGDMLDSRIEPSVLQKVVYLSNKDVYKFCGQSEFPAPHGSFAVGTPPPPKGLPPAKVMTATDDLSAQQKGDLETLYGLAEALHRKRLAKGAFPHFMPTPSVEVSLPVEKDRDGGDRTGDPYIRIEYAVGEDCRVVSSNMLLAGEVAARWCHARGVPIPYRRETDSDRHMSEAVRLTRERLYPQLERGIDLSPSQRRELWAIVGKVQNTIAPGPFFIVGADMYTRVTSPLRRFGDMLVHWQVHAALALERQLGRAVKPDDIRDCKDLPFSDEELEPALSQYTTRERLVRQLHGGGDEWILQALVRAWRFGQAALPASFKFRVCGLGRRSILGELDWFGRAAIMPLDGLNGVARIADMREGDEFEVELDQVNVHSRTIAVRALRKLDGGVVAAG